MMEYLGYHDKINDIRMLLQHPNYMKTIIMIVEGVSDIKLYRSIINLSSVEIKSAGGKQDLPKMVEDLQNNYPNNIIGICDADFDHIFGETKNKELKSIYVTDEHDSETMIFNSDALLSFINEYSKPSKRDYLISNLKDSVLSASKTIGTLRFLNHKEHLNLNFKGLKFNDFMTANLLDININIVELIKELNIRSPNKKKIVSISDFNSTLDDINKNNYCPLQICCGHDISNIIALIFRQDKISLTTNMSFDCVEKDLRLAFNEDLFKYKKIYTKLVQKHYHLTTNFNK